MQIMRVPPGRHERDHTRPEIDLSALKDLDHEVAIDHAGHLSEMWKKDLTHFTLFPLRNTANSVSKYFVPPKKGVFLTGLVNQRINIIEHGRPGGLAVTLEC